MQTLNSLTCPAHRLGCAELVLLSSEDFWPNTPCPQELRAAGAGSLKAEGYNLNKRFVWNTVQGTAQSNKHEQVGRGSFQRNGNETAPTVPNLRPTQVDAPPAPHSSMRSHADATEPAPPLVVAQMRRMWTAHDQVTELDARTRGKEVDADFEARAALLHPRLRRTRGYGGSAG